MGPRSRFGAATALQYLHRDLDHSSSTFILIAQTPCCLPVMVYLVDGLLSALSRFKRCLSALETTVLRDITLDVYNKAKLIGAPDNEDIVSYIVQLVLVRWYLGLRIWGRPDESEEQQRLEEVCLSLQVLHVSLALFVQCLEDLSLNPRYFV